MRGKYIFALLLAFCLAVAQPAFAAEPTDAPAWKVYDNADLFDDAEEVALQERAEEILRDCGLDMVFLTTEDTGDREARVYAADFYEQNGFGADAEASGIIMIVDMGERDAEIVTCGTAITIFTDYYLDRIWNGMVGSLSDGDYFAAMETLCDSVVYYCGEYRKYEENPEYVSEYQAERQKQTVAGAVGIAAVASAVLAGVCVALMRRGNRNVRPYTDGRAYLKENGFTLSVDRDTFASTHTARVPIPKNDDTHHHHGGGSWGGSSSTFHSSGGHSFGGHGGKF